MLKPLAIRYAFVAAALAAIFIFAEHLMGYNTIHHDKGQYTRMFPAYISYAILFFCIQAQRKIESPFTYMNAFAIGIGMYVVYSLLFTIIIILYQHFINPEFYETFRAFTVQHLDAIKASEEVRKSALIEVDMSYNGSPVSYLLLFIFSSVSGIILSAIFSIFLKKK